MFSKNYYKISLITVIVFTLLISCANTDSPAPVSTPVADPPLKSINPKVKFGSRIAPIGENQKYIDIVKTEFNACQTTWYARWEGWPAKGKYEFEKFNANINWMKDNNIYPMMHMLLGPNQYMPDWLINGNFTADELDTQMKEMIFGIMDSNDNKNKVEVWNVINELFKSDGTYQETILWTKMGWEADKSGLSGGDAINTMHPVFVRKAFTYARQKTTKKLELRDHTIEYVDNNINRSRKYKAIYQLLKHMKNTNIPVDAIGIQGHHDINNVGYMVVNNDMRNTVKNFKDLGLEVYINEMDIGTKQTWSTDLEAAQKRDYYNYLKQAIEGGVNIINVWGFYDGQDKGWRTNENPLPWNNSLEKKQAYFGIVNALKETK
jgi:GH35 family endo-1,4-beta-xylanase